MKGADREPAVVVRDLERRFGDFVAVGGVSFRVEAGEIFGFLGPNGAGKSTTIRMLTGILAPTGGNGTVAGFDIRSEAERIKGEIGYMSQRFSLYEDLTVEENIDFYAGIYRVPGARLAARKRWVVEMAGLETRLRARTADLPGGWKQRLSLGCALLHEPRILFLDEPTSGVDPLSRRRFWDLIHQLAADGVTVFVTTHYMDEAEHCDRVGLIYRGELIALDSPRRLASERMSDVVLDVRCDRPHEAIDPVGDLAAVKDVSLFGNGLHVVTDRAAQVAGEIRALLVERGHTVGRLVPIVPSLEDVFVSLIEERDRADACRGKGAPQ